MDATVLDCCIQYQPPQYKYSLFFNNITDKNFTIYAKIIKTQQRIKYKNRIDQGDYPLIFIKINYIKITLTVKQFK
jgi:hypothetical protein